MKMMMMRANEREKKIVYQVELHHNNDCGGIWSGNEEKAERRRKKEIHGLSE